VDIDLFIARNEPTWQRLDDATRRARGARSTGTDIEELVQLYQRTSTHLSHVRDHYRDGPLTVRLTRLVAEANAAIYRRRGSSTAAIRTFLSVSFPAAVWSARRHIAVSSTLFLLPALLVAVWLANSPVAVELTGPAAVREAYINEDFEAYYSSSHAAQFSTEVLVNNIQVSFLAFVGGALLCLGGVYILAFNGLNLGVAGGLFASVGRLDHFFGLILPHGLLEITAILVAGGAGLRVGWAIVAPGDLSRGEAATFEARRSVTVVLGLMGAFVVAGLIEGFVTPSGLPTWGRVGIGVLVEVFFVLWIVVYGRAAEAVGATGVMGELDRRWEDEPLPELPEHAALRAADLAAG
jgi:uncharacterized membrane protein SpoIIM required for sporulation